MTNRPRRPPRALQGLGDQLRVSAAGRPGALRGKLERLLASHDVRLRCDEAAWQFRHARLSAVRPEDGSQGPYGGLVQAAALVGAFAEEQAALLHARSPMSSRQYRVEFLDNER